jgi:putative flippase GtrA
VSTVTIMALLGARERVGLVTVVRGLYGQFRHLIHEVAKFGVVGAIAFLVTTIGTNLLHFRAGLGPLTSNVIATIVATCLAYFGNRYWTFRYREGSTLAREYVVFFALNGIGLGIQLACIGFTYYLLGMHGKLAYNVALIFGIGLGTLFRFWSYRRWIWLAPAAADADAMAGGGQPLAAGSPVAARAAVLHPVHGRVGNGHSPDLFRPNRNGHGNGHGVRDRGAPTAQPSRDGWDS